MLEHEGAADDDPLPVDDHRYLPVEDHVSLVHTGSAVGRHPVDAMVVPRDLAVVADDLPLRLGVGVDAGHVDPAIAVLVQVGRR